ncbi:hypothetical protein [Kineothrix sedimenti]|uniref:Uncharacterized protein n=1 Tax=Kineothrix sedimenti TaxID=3123317 RepID=A0ABZ3F1S5_9FIRM
MEKILTEINRKLETGYAALDLEVDFGYTNGNAEIEGYYLSKLNGRGSIPITEVLCGKEEVDTNLLIEELDKLDIWHCF